MKRAIPLAALMLAALLCACGQGEVPVPEESAAPPVEPVPAPPLESRTAQTPPAVTPAPESSQTPRETPGPTQVTEPTPTTGSTPDPVLHYRTTRSYDPETGIRRTTLDPQGYYLSLFFEVPVFEEKGEGYQKINRFFDDLERQFFTPENEILTAAWSNTVETEMPITEEQPFFYERNAWINSQTDKLVSVTIDYHWMMGGVHDVGTDSYTFRTDTGELVKLTDLVDESEEEVREIIFAALEERNSQEEYGVGQIELEYLQDYTLNYFEFCVVDDQIVIRFDRYEASYGAYGNFAVTLPIEINPKF